MKKSVKVKAISLVLSLALVLSHDGSKPYGTSARVKRS